MCREEHACDLGLVVKGGKLVGLVEGSLRAGNVFGENKLTINDGSDTVAHRGWLFVGRKVVKGEDHGSWKNFEIALRRMDSAEGCAGGGARNGPQGRSLGSSGRILSWKSL